MNTIRYAVRSLAHSKRLTLAAVACLGLGAAATSSVGALVSATLLRPLPFPSPERLVRIWFQEADNPRVHLSIPEFEELSRLTSFDAFLGTARSRLVAFFESGAERLRGEAVTPGYFETLGVRPRLGRLLTAEDHHPGAPPVAVLSSRTWTSRYAADPQVVGRILRTERLSFTIVGVAPATFAGTVEEDLVDLWMPLAHYQPAPLLQDRNARSAWAIGRLREGVGLEAARAEATALGRALREQHEDVYRRLSLTVEPMGENWRSGLRASGLLLVGASALLLLVAAINVAGLLLARVLDRRRELAVRSALGAGRKRLLLQLTVEALLIVALGGALGLAAAPWVLEAFLELSPVDLPHYLTVTLDTRSLVLSTLVLAVTGLLAGCAPALVGSRAEPTEAFREGGRGSLSGRRERRWGGLLVAGETALTLVLLVMGGLLLRSWERLERLDLGYRTEGIARLAVSLSRLDAPDDAPSPRLLRHPARRARRVSRGRGGGARVADDAPVGRVAAASPLRQLESGHPRGRDGGRRPWGRARPLPRAGHSARGRSRPRAVGRALERPRGGGEPRARGAAGGSGSGDRARAHDPSGRRSPLGYLPGGRSGGECRLGRRRRHRRSSLHPLRDPADVRAGREDLYLSIHQFALRRLSVGVLTRGDPAAFIDPLRRRIAELAPSSAVHWTSTMSEELAREYAPSRFYALLVASFSASALVLTGVGVFALLAHGVARRTPEIGLRVALGATPRDVLHLVLGGGLLPVVAGVTLGLLGALGASQLVGGLLYDVSPCDGAAFLGAAVVLLLVALPAGLLPARQATSLDPMRALRSE